ncbi:hypothetical protein CBL_20660 [Carabus blaptoides fortunei]
MKEKKGFRFGSDLVPILVQSLKFRPYLHKHGQQIILNVYEGLLTEFEETIAVPKTSQLTKICLKTVQRIILLGKPLSDEEGWYKNALLLSVGDIKTTYANYHENVTPALFEKWFINNLIPNIVPDSVIKNDGGDGVHLSRYGTLSKDFEEILEQFKQVGGTLRSRPASGVAATLSARGRKSPIYEEFSAIGGRGQETLKAHSLARLC